MITNLAQLSLRSSPYLNDDDNGTSTLFNQSLNETSDSKWLTRSIYFNEIINGAYGNAYIFREPVVNDNIVYDITHNGRFHLMFKGLKYYMNISDLWYMNAMLVGYDLSFQDPISQKLVTGVSLQSFANINLGVDAMFLSTESILPAGRTIQQGIFDATEVGIRLVVFVDKLDVIERTVGTKKIKNLQFHFTLKAYLIDANFKDFTTAAMLGQKSFYYEQTIPTFVRRDFSTPASIKTGWGHFLYPLVTGDDTAITYVKLEHVLKTIYNGMIFSQSTDNQSLRIDSSDLLNWLNTDTTLRNASSAYEPVAVEPNQAAPAGPFGEKNVLKNWLVQMTDAATLRGNNSANFILSYDNIYWEPLADVYSGDIYSNSPATFMTRMTTYYEGFGPTPIDEPGNFEARGGYVKARRKYFLSNLIQHILTPIPNPFPGYAPIYDPIDKNIVSPILSTETPDRFMGQKFFPFYKFKQYKNEQTQKELLDLITVPFTGPSTITNIVDCETSIELKKVVPDGLNQYRRKIITKPHSLPASIGSTTVERINAIGFVEYVKNDGTSVVFSLNVDNGLIDAGRNIFSFITWPFINPSIIGEAAQWTRNGRYRTNAKDLRTKNYLSIVANPYKTEKLCTIMNSGMYDTPEDAYIEYKSVIENITITSLQPSPTDPQWKEYFNCLPSAEITEETEEYCDPSPSPDGRRILKRISKQRVSIAANGTRTLIGSPTYIEPYPSTTVVISGQTRVINGVNVKGTETIVYENCTQVSSTFKPDPAPPPVQPTGPTGPTTQTSGPVVTGVNVSFENFINPAIFKRNIIKLVPSQYPISLELENAYYAFEFDEENVGDSSSDYTVRIYPGTRGQVLIIEVNTLGTPYKGMLLENGSVLANNNTNQKLRLTTEFWGDGGGIPFRGYLFLIYDGNDWVEFLRRDIY